MDALALFFRPYTRRELMNDSRWLLALFAALLMQAGLVQAIARVHETDFSLPMFLGAIGAFFLAASIQRLFWVRFAFMAAWTGLMTIDFLTRKNPLSIAAGGIGLFYIYKMIRYFNNEEKVSPVEKLEKKDFKEPTFLCLAIALFLGLGMVSQAWADWIDIRGEGVKNGRIVSEDADSVTFRDNYGKTQTYARNEIQLMEKTKETTSMASSAAKGPTAKAKKAADIFEPAETFKLLDPNSDQSKRAYESGENPYYAFLVLSWESLYKTINDFFSYDADYESLFLGAKEQTEKRVKNYGQGDIVMGTIGMGLMGIGFLVMIGYGIIILIKAFGEGMLWGLGMMSMGLRATAGFLDGPLALALEIVPILVNMAFIVSRWEVVRSAVVGQLFGANVLLAGMFVLARVS